MFSKWLNEYRIKRRARDVIKTADSILKRYSSSLSPERTESVREKLIQAENALRNGNIKDLTVRVPELEKTVEENLSKFRKSRLRQNVESIAIAIILALLIRTFVVQPFKIPSGSMIPTLLIGDHLLVSKFIYGTKIPFAEKKVFPIEPIKRGDVAVFLYPNYERDPQKEGLDYIKRVVGLPGDSIDIKGRNLYINGEKIPLRYIGEYIDERSGDVFDKYEEDLFGEKHEVIYMKGKDSTDRGRVLPVKSVPEGHVFVVGDNRDSSFDSRFWGFVPIQSIAGRAFMVHWSWNWDGGGILNKVRWERVCSIIY